MHLFILRQGVFPNLYLQHLSKPRQLIAGDAGFTQVMHNTQQHLAVIASNPRPLIQDRPQIGGMLMSIDGFLEPWLASMEKHLLILLYWLEQQLSITAHEFLKQKLWEWWCVNVHVHGFGPWLFQTYKHGHGDITTSPHKFQDKTTSFQFSVAKEMTSEISISPKAPAIRGEVCGGEWCKSFAVHSFRAPKPCESMNWSRTMPTDLWWLLESLLFETNQGMI